MVRALSLPQLPKGRWRTAGYLGRLRDQYLSLGGCRCLNLRIHTRHNLVTLRQLRQLVKLSIDPMA